MKGFRKLGESLFSRGLTSRLRVGTRMTAGGDATAPTATISCTSATATVASMQIVWSEVVTGFAVGDITISAGGSLASFATVDNQTFTVDWTPAAGANTLDIAAGVCQDLAGNTNLAATQYNLISLALTPASGDDTTIDGDLATYNAGAYNRIYVGEANNQADLTRTLIKFDFTSIPAGSTVLNATLSLYLFSELSSNARTLRVFRQKRAWVAGTRGFADDNPATGATWNRYDTTNNWQTAGGFGANDCEQTDIGSLSLSATETLNEYKNWTLTASAITQMLTGGSWTNNGFLIKADTEDADQYTFISFENATNPKPKMTFLYTTNP